MLDSRNKIKFPIGEMMLEIFLSQVLEMWTGLGPTGETGASVQKPVGEDFR